MRRNSGLGTGEEAGDRGQGEVVVSFQAQQRKSIESAAAGTRAGRKFGDDLRAASSSSSSGGGEGFLDAVQSSRFIFSMSIVIEHSLAQCLGRTGHGIQKFGFLWTQMFFIISGFVLTYASRSRGFPASVKGRVTFFLQRYFSVWYPYVFVWICVNGLRMVMQRPERISKGWLPAIELTMLQAWFPGFPTSEEYSWRLTNGPTWFLSAISFHYCLMPAIDHLYIKCLNWLGLLAVIAAAWAFSWVPFNVCTAYHPDILAFNVMMYNPLLFLPTTAAAMALGRLYVEYQRELAKGQDAARAVQWLHAVALHAPAATCILVGAYTTIIIDSHEATDYYQSEFMFMSRHGRWLPLELLLMWCLACESHVDPVQWVLKRPTMVFLGGIGLNTYLLHFPMKQIVEDWQMLKNVPDKQRDRWCKSNVYRSPQFLDNVQYVPKVDVHMLTPHPNVWFIVYITVLLAAAVAMHHFIEGPVRRLIRRMFPRETPPVPGEEERAAWWHRPVSVLGSCTYLALALGAGGALTVWGKRWSYKSMNLSNEADLSTCSWSS